MSWRLQVHNEIFELEVQNDTIVSVRVMEGQAFDHSLTWSIDQFMPDLESIPGILLRDQAVFTGTRSCTVTMEDKRINVSNKKCDVDSI